MEHPTVFVVSDDAAIRDSIAEFVAAEGIRAEAYCSIEDWLGGVPPERPGCVVLDARARDFADLALGRRFASICAARAVVLLIDRGDVPVAVRAIRDGAADVLEKPYREGTLLERIKAAMAREHHAITGR